MSGPLIVKETQNSNSSGKNFKIYFDYCRENRAKTIKYYTLSRNSIKVKNPLTERSLKLKV